MTIRYRIVDQHGQTIMHSFPTERSAAHWRDTLAQRAREVDAANAALGLGQFVMPTYTVEKEQQ